MLDLGARDTAFTDASTFDFDLFTVAEQSSSSSSTLTKTKTAPTTRRHDFHSVDAVRNRARFYRLTETTNLFGERCLVIEYGRIATDLCKRRVEYFHDEFALSLRFDELVSLRKSHGYALVFSA